MTGVVVFGKTNYNPNRRMHAFLQREKHLKTGHKSSCFARNTPKTPLQRPSMWKTTGVVLFPGFNYPQNPLYNPSTKVFYDLPKRPIP